MLSRSVPLPTEENFAAAREVVAQYLTPTPLVPSPVRRAAWLKLESFQPTGSFKVRGALAAVAAAPADRNLIAASAGNHALGIAFAAEKLGRKTMVVVPETASEAKLAALRNLPAQIVTHGDDYDEAEMWAVSRADAPAKDVDLISPYNDPHVIAGQATIVDEIVAQHESDRPLTIIAGAGGGGLLSGIGLRASHLGSSGRPIRVIGVEAENSPALSTSIETGEIAPIGIDVTLADGLAGNLEPGSITPELLRRHVAELVQVTEDDIADAMRWLITHHGIVAEGAGAVPVAALLQGLVSDEYLDGDVIAVISGRNITLQTLASVLRGEDIVPAEE